MSAGPGMNSFTMTDEYYFPYVTQSIVTGDFDNDGKIDAIEIGSSGSEGAASVFGYLQGNGDGTFGQQGVDDFRSDPRTFSLPGRALGGVTVDFNKDGKLDLAVSFTSTNSTQTTPSGGVVILLGNGNGTFQAPSLISISGGALTLKVADLNKDGNADLGVKWSNGFPGSGFSTLIGNGDGTFSNPNANNGGSLNSSNEIEQSFALKDITNDGIVDLIEPYTGYNYIDIHKGLGNGNFEFSHRVYTTELAYGPIDVADINGDGQMDVAVGTSGGVEVFLGKSDGTLGNPITSFQDIYPQRYKNFGSIVSKDVNGDNRADVIVADVFGGSYVGYSRGDGTFQFSVLNKNPTNSGGFFTAIAVDDFNSDQLLDVITSPYSGPSYVHTQQLLPSAILNIVGSTTAGSEGNSGSTTFSFTVTRSGDLRGVSSATYAVGPADTGASASANDFVGGSYATGSVSFAAGETTKTITVLVAGDIEMESEEAFSVRLANPIGAALNADTATATIIEDDIATSRADNLITGANSPFDIDLMAGDDRLTITAGSYRVLGNNGNDTISAAGSRGAVIFFGGDGDDQLSGGTGNDTLDGGLGADRLVGGLGNDFYFVDNVGDIAVEADGQGTDSVFTSASYSLAGQFIENLTLTGSGNINATGNALINTLTGNAGNNVLNGGAGADNLIGYGGNDTYLVDNAGDRVFEAVGGGNDIIRASVSYALAAGQEIEVLATTSDAGTDAINLVGNEFANTIRGNAGNNILNGGIGADNLGGYGGNDTYIVDNAGDRVFEAVGGGNDIIRTSVNYTLAAGQEIEVFATTRDTGTDAINLSGNEFANTIRGNAGNNVLNGGAGADNLGGYGGNDSYLVDNTGDRVFEAVGGGNDIVRASVNYTLAAGQEIETLATTIDAGTGTINLTGNEFANIVRGNAGNNVLNGLGGADTMSGGVGSDTFVFSTALGSTNIDRITDFSAVDDTIQLSKSIFTMISAGTLAASAFKDLSVTNATVDADDRILYDRTTGALSYDADGSGSKAAVQFTVLDNKAALTNADFFVV